MSTTITTDESRATTPLVEEQVTHANSVLMGSEVSLLDLVIVFVAHWRTVVLTSVAVAAITTVVVLLLPNYYTGEAVILTPSQPMSVSSVIMGDLGGALAGLGGAADTLGLKDPNDKYIAMLKSRTIADNLIKQFNLAPYYDEDRYMDMLDDFNKDTNISSGHDGTITIDYLHKDPKVAAAVANAFVDQLQKLSQDLAVSEASQRKIFFSRQLEKVREELSNAEIGMKKSMETTGLLDLDKQANAMVSTMASLQGQIMGQEILIKGLMSSSTPRNPDVIRAQEELATMKRQLADLQRKSGGGNGDVLVATGKLPASGLEYMRNLRNVKYYEAIFEVLAKQYEAAVVDETTSGALVQTVSKAVSPDRKTKPKRSLLIIAAGLGTFIVVYLGVFSLEFVRRLEQDPVDGPRVGSTMTRIRAGWRRVMTKLPGRRRLTTN